MSRNSQSVCSSISPTQMKPACLLPSYTSPIDGIRGPFSVILGPPGHKANKVSSTAQAQPKPVMSMGELLWRANRTLKLLEVGWELISELSPAWWLYQVWKPRVFLAKPPLSSKSRSFSFQARSYIKILFIFSLPLNLQG